MRVRLPVTKTESASVKRNKRYKKAPVLPGLFCRFVRESVLNNLNLFVTGLALISTIVSGSIAVWVSRFKSKRDEEIANRKEWDTIFICAFPELVESASLLHHGEKVFPWVRSVILS